MVIIITIIIKIKIVTIVIMKIVIKIMLVIVVMITNNLFHPGNFSTGSTIVVSCYYYEKIRSKKCPEISISKRAKTPFLCNLVNFNKNTTYLGYNENY